MVRKDIIERYEKYLPKGVRFHYVPEEGFNSKYYIEIECQKHGVQRLRIDTLKHVGCKVCNRESKKSRYDKKWEKDCTAIHEGKYDYTNTVVGDVLSKSEIFCKSCDFVFHQTPASHKYGKGCPKCGIEKARKSSRNDIDFVENKARDLGFNYDFSRAVYKTCKDPIEVICDKGHMFRVPPDFITNAGLGCPKCSKGYVHSKAEKEVAQALPGYLIKKFNDRKILEGREVDIFLPQINVGIEYNGIYWHCNKNIGDTQYHKNKKFKSNKNGVRLIHIYEDDWTHRRRQSELYIEDQLKVKYFLENYPPHYGCYAWRDLTEEEYQLYHKSKVVTGVAFEGIKGLVHEGVIVAFMPYKHAKDGCVVFTDFVRCIDAVAHDFLEVFVYIMEKESNTKFKLVIRADTLYDLHMEHLGYKMVGHTPPNKLPVVSGQRTYDKSIESDRYIYDSGFFLYEINH